MMAIDRKHLEKAVEINTQRVKIAQERVQAWNDRQRRFLAAATGNGQTKRTWFVIATENNCEKAVYNRLLDAGIQTWLPVHLDKVKRRKGGPKLTKEICVWPGYIFVFVVPIAESWAGIAAIKSVKSILTDGRNPIPLKEKEVSNLRELVLSGDIQRQAKANAAPFALGQAIRVIDGPFASFAGVVEQCAADDDQLRIDVEIFGRSTPVWLGLDQIERVR